MSGGINKVIIIGNVGNDPEVKRIDNGNAVANFSIATSETWKDKDSGQKQEKTEWHRIVVWGRLAEIIEQYVKKGSKLYLEGKLQTRSYEQDGVKKYTTEIKCHEMQMLDSKGDYQQGALSQPQQQAQQPQQAPPSGFHDFDDDIPF